MAEILWADYSWARPNVDRYEGVMRYLYAARGTRPDLTGAEVNDLHQQGKPIGLIWQADKGGAGEGKQRGAADAQRANREADKLGAPESAAIFYTVDSGSLSPEDVAPYFAGVRSVPGRPVGIYGSAAICDWAHGVGIDWRWQTLAWSAGVISPHAHLYQRDHDTQDKPPTGLLDRNVKFADFPAWEPKAVSKPKEPQPMDIISRNEWGAESWHGHPYRNSIRNRTHFVVHYEGGHPTTATGNEIPRRIERAHLNNGWSGIGYNFVVSQAGEIFEGRGWDLVGAHCPGRNRDGIGVQIHVGGDQEPSDAAKRAVVWLYGEANRKAGRTLVTGVHGDWYATLCAGRKVSPWVHAGMKLRDGGTQDVPFTPPKPKPQDRYWTPTSDRTTKQIQKIVGVTVDGYYGPSTRSAVRQLQKRLGVTADGYFGPATEKAYEASLKKGSGKKAPKFPLPNGHWYGPESSDPKNHSGYWKRDRAGIKKWQRRMKKRGWTITPDGRYGTRTADVAESFQREKGLAVDSLVGPATWAAVWTEPVT